MPARTCELAMLNRRMFGQQLKLSVLQSLNSKSTSFSLELRYVGKSSCPRDGLFAVGRRRR